MSLVAALAQRYRTLALSLGHLLLLFVLLNLVLAAALALRDTLAPGDDPTAAVLSAYPGLSAAEIATLRRETGTQALDYEPFTVFRERPQRGRYLNVDAAGFRHSSAQGPWPPDPAAFNVFVLGGSTTFGYGVADDQTL